MKNNTAIYALAFLLFAGGLGYLCMEGFSENSVYFLNVGEAKAVEPQKLLQARLFGVVGEENLEQTPISLSFHLADKDNASLVIPVAYSGPVPDTFKSGAEVIVEGGMGEDGSFLAKTLMTKCPSKYQKENREKILAKAP